MFTGIVTELGEVASIRRTGTGAVLSVKAESAAGAAEIGDSIAINGACLTVTKIDGATVSFDLSGETLDSTTLGRLKGGERVNIEEALKADGKLGGHFVTGHVDAVGKIIGKTKDGETFKYQIQASPGVMEFLVEKGSVAVDGISLTVVDVLEDSFTLVIIPHTADVTTMGFRGRGDEVNLEADIIGKYVMRFLKRKNGSDTGLMEALKREGFVSP
jgi:riboflavin synthase